MQIYSLALDAVSAVHEDVSPMLARHDAELANQLHRAIRSVALNVSEGLGLLGGKRQRSHFQIALGSARESKTCIELGLATRALKRSARVEQALDRLDHVCAILWKLTRRHVA
ncbi:MAG: four helix bundle protein [Deltaproteobacteria bacterium]|nr:four helix bundle protein [Deltaproteobacteria bacterium]